MGYPVAAYRTNGNTERRKPGGGRGFQERRRPGNPSRPPAYTRPNQVPKPGGWRPFPQPKPPSTSVFGKRVPKGVLTVARRSRPIAKLLTRGVPVVGTAMLLYDIGDFALRWTPGVLAVWFWEVVSSCGRMGYSYTAQSTTCSATIGDPYSPGPYGRPMPLGANLITFMQPQFTQNVYGEWNFKQARTMRRRSWMYPGLRRMPQPNVLPRYKPRTQPDYRPAVDPFIIPMTEPLLPTPQPLPRGVRSPATAAEGNWSQSGNSRNPRPSGRPKPYHPHRRPKPREKEKKSRVRQGFAIALKAGYAATEMKDAVEALTDGVWTPFGTLPPAFPQWVLDKLPKDATVLDKIKLAVRYWGELDPSQAVVNLGANQLIDVAVGVPQGKLTQFANQHGFVHGPLAFDGLKI